MCSFYDQKSTEIEINIGRQQKQVIDVFVHLLKVCVCVCVCVCVFVFVCVLFIYTISISIICVLQKEPSLVASNQQIYDFFKWIIFEKRRHCRSFQEIFNMCVAKCTQIFLGVQWCVICIFLFLRFHNFIEGFCAYA